YYCSPLVVFSHSHSHSPLDLLAPFIPFFFHPYAHHPDLLSFPTRRSSDLASRSFLKSSARTAPPKIPGWSAAPTKLPPSATATRSEEHTSELQSHLNLVCRLLLEKKRRIRLTYSSIDVY